MNPRRRLSRVDRTSGDNLIPARRGSMRLVIWREVAERADQPAFDP
jgi:hypothetical protein